MENNITYENDTLYLEITRDRFLEDFKKYKDNLISVSIQNNDGMFVCTSEMIKYGMLRFDCIYLSLKDLGLMMVDVNNFHKFYVAKVYQDVIEYKADSDSGTVYYRIKKEG